MKDSNGFERYQAAMADWVSDMMGAKGKPLPAPEDFSPEELILFNEIFRRFAEITEALDNIELCMRFVGARTPRAKGLKLDTYLNYHISFYIQEIYILKERIKKYTKKIMRLRRDRGLAIEPSKYARAIDRVEQSLSSIVSARGSHVHDRPFNDENMHMLGAYSFLAVQRPSDPNWSRYAHQEYSDVKKTWMKRFRRNHEDLKNIIDTFFSFLYLEVFDGNLLISPANWSTPRQDQNS